MENPFEIIEDRLNKIEAMLEIILTHLPNTMEYQRLFSPEASIDSTPEKLSISELAKYLNCSKVTIHNYKKRKIFPYYGTGRLTFFKRSEVDAALCSQGSINKRHF